MPSGGAPGFLNVHFTKKINLNLDWFQMHLKSSWGAFRDRLSVPIIITNLKPEIPSLGKNHPPAGKTTRGEAQAHPACPGAASQVHFPKKLKRKIKKHQNTPTSAELCGQVCGGQPSPGGARRCRLREPCPQGPRGDPAGLPEHPPARCAPGPAPGPLEGNSDLSQASTR